MERDERIGFCLSDASRAASRTPVRLSSRQQLYCPYASTRSPNSRRLTANCAARRRAVRFRPLPGVCRLHGSSGAVTQTPHLFPASIADGRRINLVDPNKHNKKELYSGLLRVSEIGFDDTHQFAVFAFTLVRSGRKGSLIGGAEPSNSEKPMTSEHGQMKPA